MESRRDTKFVVIGATTGCFNDNLRYHQWRQIITMTSVPVECNCSPETKHWISKYTLPEKNVEYLDNTIKTLVIDIMICLKLFDAHHKQVLWHEGKSNVQCYGRQIQFGIFEIIDTQYNLLECATFYTSP